MCVDDLVHWELSSIYSDMNLEKLLKFTHSDDRFSKRLLLAFISMAAYNTHAALQYNINAQSSKLNEKCVLCVRFSIHAWVVNVSW